MGTKLVPAYIHINLYLCTAFRRQTIPPIGGFMIHKLNSKPKREPQSRVWFPGHGFHPVPPSEYIDFKILYAHESDLRFVNKYGQEMAIRFNQALRNPQKHHGHGEPYLQIASKIARKCHILRALAFYGERPTYINKKGEVKPYHCHHLNGDLEDHRKDNLLAWLHPLQHRIADNRQKELKKVVPNGDLHQLDYATLRYLQDPRITTHEEFEKELKMKIKN